MQRTTEGIDHIITAFSKPAKKMKQITFRQLQTRLPSRKELPVEITRYGKVIGVLCLQEDFTATLTATKPIEANVTATSPEPKPVLQQHTRVGEVVEKVTAVYVGRCEAPYCKHTGTVYDGLYKEWFNGELYTKPMKLCKVHLQKYQSMEE